MTDIIKLLKNRIIFVIEGPYVEKILNRIDEAEKIERIDADKARVTASLKEYRKIRDFCRANGYKTKIKRKSGIAFSTYFLRGRYGLLVGLGIFIFTLYILTSRIWTLSVTSDQADEMRIYEIASQYGIVSGAKKADLDIPKINRDVMINYPELQYFNVNFYGCHGEIVVKQRDNFKQVVDENAYCDIVADRDGIVEKIIVKDGTAAVETGDTVIAGDMLIRGEISYVKDEETVTQPVRASGEITLRTWRRHYEAVPKYFNFKAYTGRERKKYKLIVGNRCFPLYFLEKNPYMCYDKRYKVSYFTLFDGNRLPLGLSCETYREAEFKKAVFEADESEIFKEMRENLLSRSGIVEIRSDSFEIIDKGEYHLAKYEAECLEKAGVEN
ncbi:MAG: sporulation protein YqfD [Clostridia bacterium]|nr:sporulation protein YqfD [Clostridia bacterium]